MSIWRDVDALAVPNHNDTTNRDAPGNHSLLAPSSDGADALSLRKADGTTILDTLNTTTGVRKFGDVAGGNTLEIEADGTAKFNGDATVYKDLIMPATNLRTGTTPPTFAAFLNGVYGLRFDAGAADELHGAVELQHDYKEGSDLVVHVHWSPTTTNTGNIVWGFEYTVANPASTFPATTNTTGTPTAAPGVVSRHVLQNVLTISGVGLKIGAIVAFRIYRQNGGTDTFTGNAFLHSVGIHYECDTIGSRGITTK